MRMMEDYRIGSEFLVEESQSGYASSFEDLRIWQHARQQVKSVYDAFQRCQDFSFKNQICRAALSVMNNIAEGFERETAKDFSHFLITAKSSNGEVRSMTYAAEDMEYLHSEEAESLRDFARQLSKSIAAFRRHLKK